MEGNIFGQTSCIILAAGSSTRMGKSKALLKFSKDESFIQKITGTYVQSGVKQVVVVVNIELYNLILEQNIPLAKEVELVVNNFPEKGRFHSLQRGVENLKAGNYCFFQNIDNPFTSVKVLLDLISEKEKADILVPVFHNRAGHPVALSPFVIKAILQVKDRDLRIDQFLKSFSIKKIDTSDARILVNINSQEEYLNAGFEG